MAVAIFAVLAAMAYAGLDRLLRTQEAVSQQAQRLLALQRAVARLERDLGELVARPVRGNFGEPLPAFVGDGQGFEASHAAWASARVQGGVRVERVAYTLRNNTLVQQRWVVLDRAPGSQPQPQEILPAVRRWVLRYQDHAGQWLDRWPPPSGPDARSDRLPRWVEFQLVLEDLGTVTRRVAPVAPVDEAP